jgi:hypothetical protein
MVYAEYPPRSPRTAKKEKKMGRPLYRDVNGVLVTGDFTGTAQGIRCTAFFGGELRDDCFIVKQKAARRYKLQDKSDSTQAFCKLVETAPAANGEMQLIGYLNGQTASPIVINKLQKRTAIDWNGNRYTWFLQNDSSADYIVLNAI